MTNAITLADLQKAAVSYADTMALLTRPQKFTTYGRAWEQAGSQAILMQYHFARYTIGSAMRLSTLWAEKPGSDTTKLPSWNYWKG
jgi:hypothetical protein